MDVVFIHFHSNKAKKGPFIPKHDPVYRIEQDGVFIEWSGRGRPPKAFKEVKAAGDLEKYRI